MKAWLSLFAVLLVGACAQVPTQPAVDESAEWSEHRARLASLDSWFLKGRLAVRTQNDGWNVTLHWHQQPGQYTLRVLAPLGQGTAELHGNAGQVTLLTTDNRRLTAATPEALLLDNLGWTVPLAGLTWWVRGLPAPDAPVQDYSLDTEARLGTLEQSGWHITINEYKRALGRDLPRKLELVNEWLELKLVVLSWEPLDG